MRARSAARKHEDARQVARDIAKTRQYDISMKLQKESGNALRPPQAHSRSGAAPITRPLRRKRRIPFSPPPPRTSANWRSSFLHRSIREKHDSGTACDRSKRPFKSLSTRCFSTEWTDCSHSLRVQGDTTRCRNPDIQNRSDGAVLEIKSVELLTVRVPFRTLARVRVEGPASLLGMLLDGNSTERSGELKPAICAGIDRERF